MNALVFDIQPKGWGYEYLSCPEKNPQVVLSSGTSICRFQTLKKIINSWKHGRFQALRKKFGTADRAAYNLNPVTRVRFHSDEKYRNKWREARVNKRDSVTNLNLSLNRRKWKRGSRCFGFINFWLDPSTLSWQTQTKPSKQIVLNLFYPC